MYTDGIRAKFQHVFVQYSNLSHDYSYHDNNRSFVEANRIERQSIFESCVVAPALILVSRFPFPIDSARIVVVFSL